MDLLKANEKFNYTFADSQQNLANISLPLSPNILGRLVDSSEVAGQKKAFENYLKDLRPEA